MKLLQYLINLVIVLFLVISPSVVLAQKNVAVSPSPSPTITPFDSYKLFWPISAGKVMGDSLYFLKSLKENLREIFIFSDFKKADYNITLSEKRVVEGEKLFLANKDYNNGKKTLEAAQQKREKALNLINKAKEKGRYVVDLQNRMVSSLEHQRALLSYISTQIPTDQQKEISENISQLNSLLAKLQ